MGVPFPPLDFASRISYPYIEWDVSIPPGVEKDVHEPWPLYLLRLARLGVAARLVLRERPIEVHLGLLWITLLPVGELFGLAILS